MVSSYAGFLMGASTAFFPFNHTEHCSVVDPADDGLLYTVYWSNTASLEKRFATCTAALVDDKGVFFAGPTWLETTISHLDNNIDDPDTIVP